MDFEITEHIRNLPNNNARSTEKNKLIVASGHIFVSHLLMDFEIIGLTENKSKF
jgi:hypothetical protein